MKLFFDTSALIKRYLIEAGEKRVDELFAIATQIIVSPVTKIEAHSAIRRLLEEKEIDQIGYEHLKEEIDYDFKFFTQISLNQEIETRAIELIEKYQLKTLDSVQLSSCLYRKEMIDSMVVSDRKLKNSAIIENLDIIDPTEFE
jgi:hypothetical protein